jgi:hypothetical protein
MQNASATNFLRPVGTKESAMCTGSEGLSAYVSYPRTTCFRCRDYRNFGTALKVRHACVHTYLPLLDGFKNALRIKHARGVEVGIRTSSFETINFIDLTKSFNISISISISKAFFLQLAPLLPLPGTENCCISGAD